MKATKSLTLHNLDHDLYTLLLAEAETRETSLNAATKILLRERVGLTIKKKKRDLSWLFKNKWTREEADEFDKNIAGTEVINPGDW